MVDSRFLARSYDSFAGIEEQLKTGLDASLAPRGPGMLYDLVAGLGLPSGSEVLDAGCGEGRHTIELARRFAFRVVGVDPVPRHIRVARDELATAGADIPSPGAVGFGLGEANGKAGRQLLHAARLLRDPAPIVERYGQANYDIALGDCLWHVYRMIGKLCDRVYLLSAPASG